METGSLPYCIAPGPIFLWLSLCEQILSKAHRVETSLEQFSHVRCRHGIRIVSGIAGSTHAHHQPPPICKLAVGPEPRRSHRARRTFQVHCGSQQLRGQEAELSWEDCLLTGHRRTSSPKHFNYQTKPRQHLSILLNLHSYISYCGDLLDFKSPHIKES